MIEHVIKFAQTYNDGNNYFILLILTDGVISDMPQTTRVRKLWNHRTPAIDRISKWKIFQAIVAASGLPISIIIIGIGQADFSAMELLDADSIPLQSGGVQAQRDIVQFVPFNKFLSQGDPRTARLRLAKEVLAEVPRQVVGYMKANRIVPKEPRLNPIDLPPNPDQF